MIGFILTMPNCGSWNGRWTGEESLHFKSCKFSKAKEKELDGKSFYYNFGDGWGANISCKILDAKTNTKMKKKSSGFCGYDWMIDSIRFYGEILNTSQQKERAAKTAESVAVQPLTAAL